MGKSVKEIREDLMKKKGNKKLTVVEATRMAVKLKRESHNKK